MKSIVITGGTRGIGFGLVREFLRLGHSVTFCGRAQAGVAEAEAQLVTQYGAERVRGVVCNVTQLEQVRALWDAAVANFGRVDLWINNAGLNAPRMPVWELDEATLRDILEVNVLGVMYGSKVALTGMVAQGSGQLYNMEGLGSGGMVLAGSALYGSSKAALSYLTRGLVLDTKGLPVKVGFLSPGIVLTDLFTGGVEPDARTRRVANILGDRVETVAPFLVRRMLADRRHGSRIAWLTRPKIFRRFLTARFQKRDLFNP